MRLLEVWMDFHFRSIWQVCVEDHPFVNLRGIHVSFGIQISHTIIFQTLLKRHLQTEKICTNG